jgi:hypothetical protein
MKDTGAIGDSAAAGVLIGAGDTNQLSAPLRTNVEAGDGTSALVLACRSWCVFYIVYLQ